TTQHAGRRKLVRRSGLPLREPTVSQTLGGPPPAKLCRVSKARPLHVVAGDLHDQLRPQRLPRQILTLTPAAHRARPAVHRVVGAPPSPSPSPSRLLRPCPPG